jgi:hypothetical protein
MPDFDAASSNCIHEEGESDEAKDAEESEPDEDACDDDKDADVAKESKRSSSSLSINENVASARADSSRSGREL